MVREREMLFERLLVNPIIDQEKIRLLSKEGVPSTLRSVVYKILLLVFGNSSSLNIWAESELIKVYDGFFSVDTVINTDKTDINLRELFQKIDNHHNMTDRINTISSSHPVSQNNRLEVEKREYRNSIRSIIELLRMYYSYFTGLYESVVTETNEKEDWVILDENINIGEEDDVVTIQIDTVCTSTEVTNNKAKEGEQINIEEVTPKEIDEIEIKTLLDELVTRVNDENQPKKVNDINQLKKVNDEMLNDENKSKKVNNNENKSKKVNDNENKSNDEITEDENQLKMLISMSTTFEPLEENTKIFNHLVNQNNRRKIKYLPSETDMLLMEKDIRRIPPQYRFFNGIDFSYLYRNVIQIVCYQKPTMGYFQGMTDLIAPFVYLFLENDPINAEPMVYFCFTKLLSQIETDVLTQCKLQFERIIHILSVFDKDLYNLFSKNTSEVNLYLFAFNWMHCLFFRQLNINEWFRMFDYAVSMNMSEFSVFFTVAMMIHMRELFIRSDVLEIMIALRDIKKNNEITMEVLINLLKDVERMRLHYFK